MNLLTVHDGFTLRDLVSYNDKHYEENGEQNRDGTSDTASWNCGARKRGFWDSATSPISRWTTVWRITVPEPWIFWKI